MANESVLFLLFVWSVFPEGVKSVVQTQSTVLAAVGEEAHLSCQLMQPKDVLQVTWQIILPEEEKNFATYNKYFGLRVSPDFRDKVEIKAAGLQNSSVVFRKVTEQDEGCYRCIFNTYPDGAFSATTCLELYELHEPILHVRESDSTEESVVSCSATGRPAPTVTLSVTQQDLYFSHYNTVSVTNPNATVSVTTTAVLSGFHDNSIQVGCAVRIQSGPQKEVFVVIPELKQKSADDFTLTIGLLLGTMGTCVLVAFFVVYYLYKQKNKSSDPEKTKTPQKRLEEPHEILTPLFQRENEHIQKRTSVRKTPKSNTPKCLSSTAKCLEKMFEN